MSNDRASALDIRYGRGGGRRFDPVPEARPDTLHPVAACEVCQHLFRYTVPKGQEPPPALCGRLLCRAMRTWSIDDWKGQARMAAARAAAGVPLNDLDRQALQRTRIHTHRSTP